MRPQPRKAYTMQDCIDSLRKEVLSNSGGFFPALRKEVIGYR